MMHDRSALTRRWARWLGTFVGFPLAGVAARAAAGNIDSTTAAALGGLIGGGVLGAVQVGIGGIDRIGGRLGVRWTAASAAGFAAGMAAGASAVDFRTNAASLVVMGVLCGAGVGIAQALSIPMRSTDRLAWMLSTPALWALGWLLTSQVIVDADRQHLVFGSSGALAVSAISGVLHARRGRTATTPFPSFGSSTTSVVAQ